jgi:hypothetical protein
MAHVKWLRSVTVVTEPFGGYQQNVAYRYSQAREDGGEPVALMRVRSLMEPPGIPDFLTRTRVLRRGVIDLRGRAWSGRQQIVRVEVSTDGGQAWADAKLEPAASGARAWQAWHFRWQADSPGNYELVCRATDAAGDIQPVTQAWTARGMGNNMAHRLAVRVV